MTKTSNPPGFVAYRKDVSPMKDKNFRTIKANGDKISGGTTAKPEAEKNLPTHPIKPPGRFSIMVNKLYEPAPGLSFVAGRAYNVDQATKEKMDKDGYLKVATPVT